MVYFADVRAENADPDPSAPAPGSPCEILFSRAFCDLRNHAERNDCHPYLITLRLHLLRFANPVARRADGRGDEAHTLTILHGCSSSPLLLGSAGLYSCIRNRDLQAPGDFPTIDFTRERMFVSIWRRGRQSDPNNICIVYTRKGISQLTV